MTRFFKFHHFIMRVLGYVTGIYCGLLALVICLNYALQIMGLGTFPWLSEVVEYTLFATVFLAAPWILHHNGHVGIELLTTALSNRGVFWLNLFLDFFAFGIALTYCVLTVLSINDAILYDAVLRRYLAVPEWWLLYVFLTSMVFIAIECAHRFYNRIQHGYGGNSPTSTQDSLSQEVQL